MCVSWSNRDVFVQHDVQEMFHILLEALKATGGPVMKQVCDVNVLNRRNRSRTYSVHGRDTDRARETKFAHIQPYAEHV